MNAEPFAELAVEQAHLGVARACRDDMIDRFSRVDPDDAPFVRIVGPGELADAVADEVRLVGHRHRNTGVVAPIELHAAIATALELIGLHVTGRCKSAPDFRRLGARRPPVVRGNDSRRASAAHGHRRPTACRNLRLRHAG